MFNCIYELPKRASSPMICATRTPKVTPRGQRTPIDPRNCIGANSIRYIGTILVVTPGTDEFFFSAFWTNNGPLLPAVATPAGYLGSTVLRVARYTLPRIGWVKFLG